LETLHPEEAETMDNTVDTDIFLRSARAKIS
jgi:hypothetical protein